MNICLLQLNPQVGNFAQNRANLCQAMHKMADQGVDLFVTSELALVGYPPRDLLFSKRFVQASLDELALLAQEVAQLPPLLVGALEVNQGEKGHPLFNAAYLLQAGKIQQSFQKKLLPNYDVFDEERYFEPSQKSQLLLLGGKKIGVTICEDIWAEGNQEQARLYRDNPLESLAAEGMEILINLSASPFAREKQTTREAMLAGIAQKYGVSALYINQVGGNDDLVFDGRSFAVDAKGQVIARGLAFAEDQLLVRLDQPAQNSIQPRVPELEALWKALVLGTRDYLHKCGFKKAVLGLSGGVDSALVAVVAAQALGAEQVLGVLMPSPYSSRGSVLDALELARRNHIQTTEIPIAPIMQAFSTQLQPAFAGKAADVTEENLQARIRGSLLMALSNKQGAMLLTTGNKSELAVGYCTIYGDMNGGLAVISDLPKTLVYQLCHWINQNLGDLIPSEILTKAPSAELRPDQKDQDSLPPYDLLDEILEKMIEKHLSVDELEAQGYERALLLKIRGLVKRAEFKRQQAAPGLKVTAQAFGVGWRMPIASHFF